MIVNTKTGLLISGELIKDAETRQAGQRRVIKLHLRYGYDPPQEAGGNKSGKLLDVDVWRDIDALDGMLCKDDSVVVSAQQIKSREYSGKTYYSVDANGLYPSAAVVLRWMQQVIDIMRSEIEELRAEIAELKAKSEPPDASGGLAGHELYDGEKLSDYAPNSDKPKPTTTEPPIDESEDLPF